MGAYESNGYNMSVNPYWENKDKSSGGGGGSDIPDFPNLRGYFLKTVRGDNDDIELEWENFKDNVKEIMYPIFAAGDEYVGKVLTKYGTGQNDFYWMNAQAAYTDYSNLSSGLSATNVQDAIDELAQGGSGGGGAVSEISSSVSMGMKTGISEGIDIVDENGNFNLDSDIVFSTYFGKVDTTDPDNTFIPSPIAYWETTISKVMLKKIYDEWVDAGQSANYWNSMETMRLGGSVSEITVFDMKDGQGAGISMYNHDVLMPLFVNFSEGLYGMMIYVNPTPHILTTDQNNNKPIFDNENQDSTNYGMRSFYRVELKKFPEI